MQDILGEEEQKWEEEWEVLTSSKNSYTLTKMMALVLKQEMAIGNRGIVQFETFAISIPYVTDFYRTKRFLKGVKTLPDKAQEEYKPIPQEKWEKMKKELYSKIGKVIPSAKEK